MADWYVSSTATGANNGTSWADAFTGLTAAFIALSAGDTIYLDVNHREDSTANQTWVSQGTVGNPCKLISVDPNTMVPTPATAIQVGKTNGTLTVNGSLYVYGFWMEFNTNGSVNSWYVANSGQGHIQTYEHCKILNGTTGSSNIRLYTGTGSTSTLAPNKTIFRNCEFSFFSSSHAFGLRELTIFESCKIRHTNPTSTECLSRGQPASQSATTHFINCDFSEYGNDGLFSIVSYLQDNDRYYFTNCKFPSNWAGFAYSQSVVGLGWEIKMYGTDTGAAPHSTLIWGPSGDIRTDTGIYRNNGASVNGVPLSWRMTTDSTISAWPASYYGLNLQSDTIAFNVATIGSPITVSLEVAQEGGLPLTNEDVWIDVGYLFDGASTLGNNATTKRQLASAVIEYPASSFAWTGLAAPTRQTISTTFTPQLAAPVFVKVTLAKSSATVHVCPKVDLT